MHVLLVEDEPTTARLLAKGLREHGYAVDVVHDGVTATQRLADSNYDIVVLDVMLPARNGLDVCRQVCVGKSRAGADAHGARRGRGTVEGLDCGADDYVNKPFDFRELLARMRALIRRRERPLEPERITVGRLTLDARTRELFIEAAPVPLTAREYALLEYLARRSGEVVSRSEIARHVWDDAYDPLSNVIDVYVQRLRRKIDTPGEPSSIRARRGEGYQLLGASCVVTPTTAGD